MARGKKSLFSQKKNESVIKNDIDLDQVKNK